VDPIAFICSIQWATGDQSHLEDSKSQPGAHQSCLAPYQLRKYHFGFLTGSFGHHVIFDNSLKYRTLSHFCTILQLCKPSTIGYKQKPKSYHHFPFPHLRYMLLNVRTLLVGILIFILLYTSYPYPFLPSNFRKHIENHENHNIARLVLQ
jgi:hypothetical protein